MTNGWTSKRTIAASCVLVAAACATQIEDPTDGEVVVGTGGVGGDVVGMAATGGSLDAMTGVGAAMGGTGTAGAATGGTAMGGTGTGGTGMAGTGMTGTAGAGNTTGGAGKGTAGARSGRGGANQGMTAMGGKAGKAGTGAAGSSGTVMDGCAKLSVPMNGATDKAHFAISLRNATDLSAAGTTITLHVYVQAGKGGVILAYAQDSGFNFLGAATRPLLADQDGWVTLEWDIAAEPAVTPAIMKKSVSRIGIEIKAAPSATWSNPTVVYVDSISVNTPKLSFPFATTGTVSKTAQTSDVTGQVLWLNSGTNDTTATGTTLSWVATCP